MTPDLRTKAVPVEWRAPLDLWLTSLRAAGRPETTVYLRRAHIAALARAISCAPDAITPNGLITYLASHPWAAETRRSIHASIRSFSRHIGRDDLVEVIPRVRPAEPCPRPTPERVLRAARGDADARSDLILRCGAELGLRRGEIACIHSDDLIDDLVGRSLRVRGKGGKIRLVPLTDELASAIRVACRAGGGWMLPGRIGGHLSARRVGEIATDALEGSWTLHSTRHRYATRVYSATQDLVAVQRLLGHASVATTQRYVAVDADRLRAAALTAA